MAAAKGVARLASLYGMMERLRSAELLVAADAVEEIACTAAIARAAREGQVGDARAAMASGCREDWQVAETTRKVTEAQMMRLAKLQVERKAAMDAAAEVHRVSRLEMEQMERVVEQARVREAITEGRRMQAESDDRFGSRCAWARMRQSDELE